MIKHEPMKIRVLHGVKDRKYRVLMICGPCGAASYNLDPDLSPMESLRQTLDQLDRELIRKTKSRQILAAALDQFKTEVPDELL